MKCDRCSQTIDPNEAQEHFGQNLCEDCYMDALSPAKTCDPWAVHSAQSLQNPKAALWSSVKSSNKYCAY